jgi:formamidopyrimidine-DNA glycosylase
MGHGFTITCKDCGYEKEISLGVGFMYYSLENVMDQLPKPERNRLKEAVKERFHIEQIGYDLARYEKKLYVCKTCGEFSDDLHVLIRDPRDNKAVYRTRHTCRKCQSPLKQISENAFKKYPCPKCNKMTLIQGLQMLWD